VTVPVGAPSWPGLIGRLLAGQDLAADDTEWAMDQVMSGEASPAQVAGFVVALRAKGETAPEIAGLATAMLAHARSVSVPGPVVDIVGTGGDGAHTVNISTMSAVVMAAAGARVVKHGGRAASSQSGSVDVLEALGVPVDLGPEAVARCVDEVGIGFCFAQVFHPAMRHAGPVRGQLGVPTAFNLLGPLTNPARPGAALIGCADVRFAPILAEVLAARGDRAVVVRGDDGLDEVTTATTTTVWHAGPGGVRVETLDPTSLGVPVSTADDLRAMLERFRGDQMPEDDRARWRRLRGDALQPAGSAHPVRRPACTPTRHPFLSRTAQRRQPRPRRPSCRNEQSRRWAASIPR